MSKMDFETILRDVGDFGRYQKSLLFKFMVPTTFASALYVLNVLFMVATPDHWCSVPELSALNLAEHRLKSLVIPKLPDGSFSKCTMFAVNYTEMVVEFQRTGFLPDFRDGERRNAAVQKCKSGWTYQKDLYEETVVSKWDLVCDSHYLPSLVLTLANVGSMLGTTVFSTLADRCGRKTAFLANVAVAVVTGLLSIFAPTLVVFAILRFVTGSTVPTNFQLPYIITVEQVGANQRARLVCMSWVLWTLGACFLALLAYLCRHWATLGLVTTLPVAAFFAYNSYLIPSPRYLMARDRCEEAADIIRKIAKQNGREPPSDLLSKLKIINESDVKGNVKLPKHSLLDLFRYPQLRKKLFVVTLNWSAIAVAYFGLTLNVTNLGKNDFLNFFLLSAVELPAFPLALLAMERVGRRWANTVFLLLTGIACLVPSFLTKDMDTSAMVASMLGKFGSAAAFMVVYQQAAELYPTPVRALGMGIGSTVASLAVIGMPYVCFLGIYNKAIPFLLIGALCISAGLVAPLVPETLNRRLPQTVLDSEQFETGSGCFCCGSDSDTKDNEDTEDEPTV